MHLEENYCTNKKNLDLERYVNFLSQRNGFEGYLCLWHSIIKNDLPSYNEFCFKSKFDMNEST